MSALAAAESTLDGLGRLADRGLSAQEFIEEAGRRIVRVVPNEGYFFSTTDPDTLFPTGMGLVQDLPLDQCKPSWEYEFLVPDVLKFADLARSRRLVGDLHEATGGRPERSPRFRSFGGATGYRGELRMTFTVGGATWGIGQINRTGTTGRFTSDEKAWLERAAPVIAHGLRRALLDTPAEAPAARGAGIVLLDGDGSVVSMTREAAEWLDELDPAVFTTGAPGRALPFHIYGFVARARAAHLDGAPMAPARLRTRRGVWILLRVSPLERTDDVALVIEPAKASDVAPLIVEAYGLTAREVDVCRAIARGLRTAEIGAQLHLSPHTVRDHVKSVFEKVGVSSRGELVHKLFSDNYAPPPHI